MARGLPPPHFGDLGVTPQDPDLEALRADVARIEDELRIAKANLRDALDHEEAQRLRAEFLGDGNREEWHAAAIRSAGEYARRNPHLVDDYSDADPGL